MCHSSFIKGTLILIAMAGLFFPTMGMAQEDFPEAAVAPIASIGDAPEAQQQIVFTTLLTELSRYYDLVPQNRFLDAQEEVFNTLEMTECTEDQCIRRIQEILQIETLFTLQFLSQDGDTQLILTRIGLETKTAEISTCKGCNTLELSAQVQELAKKMSVLQKYPAAISPIAALGDIPKEEQKILFESFV